MESLNSIMSTINGVLWHNAVLITVLGTGVAFTIWSGFSQFRALSHGSHVLRGRYDDPADPGAINHFQALSAALSATVGLGNIGGVALAIAGGGPGALFWMWIIGFLGMALKSVEVSLAMIFRNTEDPENPHGGAMWVIDRSLGARGGVFKVVAKILGVFFCITLIVSTITGGNMFQSWNVAALTDTYFGIPRVATGIVLALIVGLVIVGGIKRIGTVAGRLDYRGEEIEPLALDEVRAAAELLRDDGVTAVAICFMHAYANPAHERAADGAHRMTDAAARHHRGPIVRLHDPLFVVRMSLALGGADEACPHLDANRTQGQSCCQPTPSGDATRGDDGNVNRIHHLGHQGQRRHVPNVPARLHPLGDEGIYPQAGHPPGKGHRRNNGND